jgi:predicted alpha/beta-fold hydrolase
MPLLTSSFRPPYLLRPPWVQTITPKLLRKPCISPGIHELLELSDGDFLELEWHGLQSASPKFPLIILSHGLEGSTKSNYLVGLISALVASNYPVLAWNMRGCGVHRNRLLPWYHSGQTEDLASIIERGSARFQDLPIVLIGISIGGNIVCKFLGERGKSIPSNIQSAIAVSPPLDLRSSAEILARPSRAIYMRYLLKPLRERMKEKAVRFPNQLDISGLSSICSFHEFDARYTAPIHGFRSVDHYWDCCSGLHFIPHTTIPTYIVSALDDPFLSPSCFPVTLAQSSSLIHLETPAYGGHVGFIDSLNMSRTWLERRILEYLSLSA